MKKIEIFKEKIPWAIIGVLLALIFGAFGIYSVVHEKKPNILYEITNETNVLDVRKPLADLSISFQGEDIQKENLNLRIFTVRVENNGEVDILQGQYDVSDIWGIQAKNSRIIEVRLINSNSDYIKSKLEPNLIQDDKIKFNKIIFEKRKFFVLEILALHEKALKPEIIPLGKIAGVERNVPIKSWEEREESFQEKVFYGNVFIHFIRFVIYSLSLIIVSVIIGLSVGGFASLINKTKSRKRKEEIIKIFGDKALAEDKKEKLLYEFYIKGGGKEVKKLNELLKDKNRLLIKIKSHELFKKYAIEGVPLELEPGEIPPPLYREDIKHALMMDSPVAKLVEKGFVSVGYNNKVIIKKEFKRVLNEFMKYLERVEKK